MTARAQQLQLQHHFAEPAVEPGETLDRAGRRYALGLLSETFGRRFATLLARLEHATPAEAAIITAELEALP